jgi:uncharacterized protein GlcG (DUF336 family)
LLTVISDSVAKMGQLIEGLLRLSRVSRADMSRSRIDMTALAQGVVDELQTSEPGRQVEVGIGPLPFADGDHVIIGVSGGTSAQDAQCACRALGAGSERAPLVE